MYLEPCRCQSDIHIPAASEDRAVPVCVAKDIQVVKLNCGQGGLIHIQSAIIGWSEGYDLEQTCVQDRDECIASSTSVMEECQSVPFCNLGRELVMRNVSVSGCGTTNFVTVAYSCIPGKWIMLLYII